MDRLIVYPGAIPLDTDNLGPQRGIMKAIGWLLQSTMGTATGISGLACTPTSPASLTVNVGPGAIWSLEEIDPNAYGSLAADTSPLMKMGINAEAAGTNFTLTAPTTSGQSINYLIEASFLEQDGTPVVLPYVNPASPSTPYSGPSNSGAAQNTIRAESVSLQLLAGAPANTGTQTTPAVTSGWVPLYVITVNYGQTTITAGGIAPSPSAPFLQANLANMPARLPAVVGSTRNLVMNVTAASATATLTADEIVVETALGGTPWRLGSFSQSINLATTGAGGMDTGAAPVSGFVAIYAIYNPTTGAAALLATNATTTKAPNVYGSTNMPAGYAASALVSVWPTTSAGLLAYGFQIDRRIGISQTTVLSTSSVQASPIAVSLAGAIPPNAKTVRGYAQYQSTTLTSEIGFALGAANPLLEVISSQGIGISSFPYDVSMTTSQTIYWQSSNATGTYGADLFVSGYTI